jgi:hypothetical protein
MDNMWIAVLVVGVSASYMFSDWVRARHGYPIKDDDGTLVHKSKDALVEKLQAENDVLKSQLVAMEERMRTMEKIVTDPSRRLADEIERLN